jgi:gp16 family phage-associated protein
MKSQKLFTREEVMADFSRKGISVRGWARKHGLSYASVRGVLSGRLSGRIGESHKAAVKLGLKYGEVVEDGSHD